MGNEETQHRGAIARQLDDLIQALPPNLAVAGILRSLSVPPTPLEYEIVTDLFGRTNSEEFELQEQLQEGVRQELRRFLKDGLGLVLGLNDFGIG